MQIIEPKVTIDIPPDKLLGGIVSCGGVREYYNFSLHEEIREQRRMNALAAQSGIRVAAPYPDNAHEVIEAAVTEVGRRGLNIVSEFIDAGLTTPLPNWWAVPSLRRQNIGQAGRAHRSEFPDVRGERFVLQRGGQSWPTPCTWANFSFNIRELANAERIGSPLDTSHVSWATYLDNEAIEDQAINGFTDEQGNLVAIDGMTLPGLLSSTNTFTYATWTGLSGADILGVVQGAIASLRAINKFGPYTLFVPSNYATKLTSDYTAGYPKTVISRLQEVGPYGGRNLKVVISDTLPDNRVILVSMTKDVVDIVEGQRPTPISWKDGPGWNTFWVVLAMVIFRMFQDTEGNYGVLAGNLA